MKRLAGLYLECPNCEAPMTAGRSLVGAAGHPGVARYECGTLLQVSHIQRSQISKTTTCERLHSATRDLKNLKRFMGSLAKQVAKAKAEGWSHNTPVYPLNVERSNAFSFPADIPGFYPPKDPTLVGLADEPFEL